MLRRTSWNRILNVVVLECPDLFAKFGGVFVLGVAGWCDVISVSCFEVGFYEFNLSNSTYQPYTKPNTALQYVHRESNHPPITTKNIPTGIYKGLSSLSSDKASFDKAAPIHPPLRTHHDRQTQKQTAKQHSLVQPSIKQERQHQHRTQIPQPNWQTLP